MRGTRETEKRTARVTPERPVNGWPFYPHVLESPETFLRLLLNMAASDLNRQVRPERVINEMFITISDYKAQRDVAMRGGPDAER